MSCVLSNIGCFQDIAIVRRFLFPDLKDEEKADLDGWNAVDWGWNEDDEQSKKGDGNSDAKNEEDQAYWLQECSISLSPTNDLMVVAFEEKAVFLQQKWDPQKDGSDYRYHIVYKGELNQEEGECITSVMCAPLASQKRSSQGAPDWTCVMIGFTSGYIRMYTENGSLLLSQLLHEDPVLKLKCRTYEVPRYPGVGEQQEELTILYPTALVTVDGFSLFQSLRACRHQLARAAASGSDVIQPPPLAYKKWGMLRQEAITDQASCGVVTPCSFDQLNTECILGGPSTNVRTTPPAASRYVTTGTGPYIGFFYALEGSSQPLISDVAIAMASKLKSALLNAASGWFGFAGQTQQGETAAKQKPKVEPATSLPIRFGIPDLRRHGDTICVSPGLSLAVSTDSFGRVVLIDIARGVAIRMWKGYRDAQCGWIQVSEDIHREMSNSPRKSRHRHQHCGLRMALFLVIYAPRRGILEVWNTQQGPRVAAFNVPKSARLLCPGYSMMGLNNISVLDSRVRPRTFQCCLMEVTGLIRTIQVPFHLALSNKNSKRARDLHLVKKLSSMLHHKNSLNEPLEDVIISIISDIKMSSYKQQALDKVLSSKGIPSMVLVKVVCTVSDQLKAQGPDGLDYEGQCLLQYCSVQSELLHAYNNLQQLQGKAVEVKGEEQAEISEDDLAEEVGIDLTDFTSWLEHLKVYLDNVCRARVHFAPDSVMDTATFLGCFQHVVSHAQRDTKKRESEEVEGGGGGEAGTRKEESSSQTNNDQLKMTLQLKDGLSEELLLQLGTFLFKPCLQGNCSVDDLCSNLEILGMSLQQLQIILLQMWLANEQCFLKRLSCLQHFYQLMMALSRMATHSDQFKTPEADTHSMWHEVQSQIKNSNKIGAALVAAIFSKCIATATINQIGQSRSSQMFLVVLTLTLPKLNHRKCKQAIVSYYKCFFFESGMETKYHNLFNAFNLRLEEAPTFPQALQESPVLDKPREEPPSSPISMDLGSEPTSSMDLSTEWVAVSLDAEQWDGLIQQLEDLLALCSVIHTKPSQETFSQLEKAVSKAWTSSQNSSGLSEIQIREISVKKILDGGRGAVAEIVASWAAQYSVPPRFLSGCSASHHNLSSQLSTEGSGSGSSCDTVLYEVRNLQELLHRLCKRFQHSLEHDVLQTHCTWEYIVHWNKNPEVTNLFGCALQHLDVIRNAVLRHGVASMVWHTFIVKRVSATAYLMDKVGKAPKDRLCRRDVGLSETALLKFLELSCELLDKIYQSDAETSLAPVFEIEDLWQHAQGPVPLVELAVGQPLPNHQLVDMHKQLCTVMHAIMVFGMRSVKVLGLFDFAARDAFFRDLHSSVSTPPGADADLGLLQSRQQFLCRVITAAVQTLLPAHAEEDDPKTRHPKSPIRSIPTEWNRLSKTHAANAWPETVIQLAVVFGIDVDLVKRHHICELYKSGYDSVAQEILVTVTEHTQMGTQLLEIAGLRLAQALILDTDSVTVEKQSLLSAPVLKWLKIKASDLGETSLRCPRPPISDTVQLVSNIAGLLPESHSRYSLALQLVEAVGTLT